MIRSVNKLLFSLTVMSALAVQTGMASEPLRHELRFMLGDMLSESVVWHEGAQRDFRGGVSGLFSEDSDYGFTPHYGISYMYGIRKWLAAGVLVDCQNNWWTRTWYDNAGDAVSCSTEHYFNLSVLPTVRFSYLDNGIWSIYSLLMFGLLVNGGSETNHLGQKTVVNWAAGVTLIGAGYRWSRWGVALELGALAGMKNINMVYMLGTRILSVGVSYSF